MIEISLALLASIIAGMVEPKVGDALCEGLVRIKYALRKPLRTAFQKAVDEVIKETKENDVVVRTALLDLRSRWETLKVEENKRLDRDNISKVFEKSVVPEEYCARLYDRINEKFLKVFADVAKKREGIFVDHVILSLSELQKDSYKRKKDLERLLLFCQNFGLDTARISSELGKIQKSLFRIERETKATKSGVERIEKRIQHLTDILWLQLPNSARLTNEQMRLLKKAERTAEKAKDRSTLLRLKAENQIIRGNYSGAKTLLNKAFEIAKSDNDEVKMANAYGFLSWIDIEEGNFAEAISKLKYGIEVHRKGQDIGLVAAGFVNLGMIYSRQGDLEKALTTFTSAESMMEERDYFSRAAVTHNIGRICADKGDYRTSRQKYEESQQLFKKVLEEGEQEEQTYSGSTKFVRQEYAKLLCSIAYLDKAEGNCKDALKHYGESMTISEELKDTLGVAMVKRDMAELLYFSGKTEDALNLLKESLHIAESSGNKTTIAEAKHHIGKFYLHIEQNDIAKEYIEASLNFFKNAREELKVVHASIDLAQLYERTGEELKALKLLEKSVELSTKLDYKLGIAVSKTGMGVIYQRALDLDTAKGLFEQVLNIYKEIGYKHGIPGTLMRIASIHSELNDFPKALELYEESLRLTRELGNMELTAEVLSGMAGVYARREKFVEAIDRYRQATDIFRKLLRKRSVAVVLHWLGNVYRLMGDTEEALKSYSEGLESAEASGDREVIGILMGYIGIVYFEKKDFARATYYLTSASFTLGEVNSPNKQLIDEYVKRIQRKPI